MEISKDRPIITPSDHPVTVYKALLRSVPLGQKELSKEKSAEWTKIAQDSWDAIRDGFGFNHPDQEGQLWRPNGSAQLYMSMDDLEYVLVGYGVRMLDEDPDKWADEIKRTDAVLVALDKALKRKKY